MLSHKELSSLVHHTVGLRVREQSAGMLRGWLQERAGGLGMAVGGYLCLLKEGSQAGRRERELLTVALTTGETYFFRDPALFALLGRELIPQLVHSRSRQRKLKIWSAGCATGEEAYSLAMLMREHAAMLDGWEVEIFASDINTDALQVARRGVYGDWSFRAIDGARQERYFHRRGRHWEIDESLVRQVSFVRLDLFKDPVPNPDIGLAGFDLVLCRNVFIYMQRDATALVSAKLAGALADDGFLIAGHGELLGLNIHGLRTRVFPEAVIFHKTQAAESWQEPASAAPVRPRPPLRAVESGQPKLSSAPVNAAHVPPPLPDEAEYQKLMQQAWASADRGQADAAIHLCDRAAVLQPLDPWPLYLKAQLAMECGEATRARALLEKVIYLDHAHIPAYIELAALLDREGHAARARKMRLAACRELKKMDPEEQIRPYESSKAAELLAYIENHLERPAAATSRPVRAAVSHDTALRRHGT